MATSETEPCQGSSPDAWALSNAREAVLFYKAAEELGVLGHNFQTLGQVRGYSTLGHSSSIREAGAFLHVFKRQNQDCSLSKMISLLLTHLFLSKIPEAGAPSLSLY